MSQPNIKTQREQKLEWLESLGRPLTEDESDQLRRALHATYCRNRYRDRVLAAHRREELGLLARIERENNL
jgi:hypothetical protein